MIYFRAGKSDLPNLTNMRSYELTIVLPEKTTAVKKKSSMEKIEKIVSSGKGKVGKVDDWGELKLAYPIAKNSAGVFLHFPLQLASELAKNLDSKLNLEENIIRYLLVRKE